MNTTANNTGTKPLTTNEDLNKLAIELINAGFTVIGSNYENPKYFNYFKDGNMAYVQIHRFGGFDFSTVHKPCKECGTGTRIITADQPTLKNAIRAWKECGITIKLHDIKFIKKWQSVEEYLNAPMHRESNYIFTI